MQKAATAYLQTSVGTTSQGEILLMLYEGAIKFLRQAQERIKERDYAQKGILISKALDIIAELESSLNIHKGGEIAGNLHRLYFFCQRRLLQANINMDAAMVDEVITILSGLRSAYQEVIKGTAAPAQGAAQATATAGPAAPVLQQPASASPAPPKPAAPDQNSMLSASFWLQKSRAASQAAAPAAAGPAKSAAVAGEAKPAAAPVQDQPVQETRSPLLLATPPAAETTPPAAAKRLAGSLLYKKMANTS